MFNLVLISLIGLAFGQVNLPHGHDLKVLVDNVFNRFDHSPKDGHVTETEFDILIVRDDANNDSCVTLEEFKAASPRMPAEIAEPVFKHDAGNDDCITVADRQEEFHRIDHNNDGVASMHEFEQYYTHLAQKLFGGHGHNAVG